MVSCHISNRVTYNPSYLLVMQHSLRNLLISILLLYVAVLPLFSQQIRFDRITTREGLPSNETFSLLQDKKGYIWICTNYGIVRYNGSYFQPVCTNIPFSEQFAFCMYEHPVHGLFFANSHANVYRVRNDSAFIIPGFEKVSRELDSKVHEVSRIYVDDSLNIFIFSKGKSFRLEKRSGYKEQCLDSVYVSAETDFAVLGLQDNYFPLVDKHRQDPRVVNFRVIDKSRQINYAIQSSAPNLKPRVVLKTAKDIYMCKDNLLMKLYPNGTYDTTRLPGYIICLAQDKQNNIWAGCYTKGLFRIDSTGKVIRHYFDGVSINAILFDNQEGLWVSTTGKGLYHSKNINNKSYGNIQGLDQRILLLKPLDSGLFISTSENRLFRMRSDGISEIILPCSTLYEITDIASAGNGYFISTKGGIYRCDRNFHSIRFLCPIAPSYGIEQGVNHLYYMNRIGIGKLEGCQPSIRAPSKVNSFIHYENDDFLVATESGLYVISDSTIYTPSKLKVFDKTPVKKLRRSADGRIWVCTKGNGLYFIDKNGTPVACAAPGKIVNDVCFPGDTMITACCSNGTFTVSLHNVRRPKLWLAVSRAESLTIACYNSLLYLGTEDGLVSLDPKSFFDNVNAPFYLVKIMAGGKRIHSLSPVFLYNQHSPEFVFEHLDYKDIDKRLHYRLSGAESRSGFTEGMKLRLDNLAAGNYTLIVSPALQRGKTSVTLRFTVEAPYWEKWWFRVLTTLGIIGLITGIVLLVYNRARIKAHKKVELSRMLAEYKLTALKAQINPHFMSNSLAAIQMLVIMNETDKAAQYLSQFSLFIRKVLAYSDKSLISLSEELKIIELYIDLEKLRFQHGFTFHQTIDPSINPDTVQISPLILQPFVENAIWHGLLPLKERKPCLTIHISRQSNVLLILVEDNGVGRKSGMKIEKDNPSQGNEIMQKRLEHINLLMGVSSARLDIEDLKDDAGNSTGTLVIITLPFSTRERKDENEVQPAGKSYQIQNNRN